jgi:hypothetical protein
MLGSPAETSLPSTDDRLQARITMLETEGDLSALETLASVMDFDLIRLYPGLSMSVVSKCISEASS